MVFLDWTLVQPETASSNCCNPAGSLPCSVTNNIAWSGRDAKIVIDCGASFGLAQLSSLSLPRYSYSLINNLIERFVVPTWLRVEMCYLLFNRCQFTPSPKFSMCGSARIFIEPFLSLPLCIIKNDSIRPVCSVPFTWQRHSSFADLYMGAYNLTEQSTWRLSFGLVAKWSTAMFGEISPRSPRTPRETRERPNKRYLVLICMCSFISFSAAMITPACSCWV